MKKRIFLLTAIILTCSISILYIIKMNASPAITYFPIDEDSVFTYAKTNLELSQETGNDSYEINWTSGSKSDKEMYLRQDASLLFDNGRLRGVRSKWVQETSEIQLQEKLASEDSSFFQVISYHHGELHYPDNLIKSIHQMSYDQLYIIDSPVTSLDSFTSPANNLEREWKSLLDRTTKQQLLYHWHQLFTHFQINSESYFAVPLTNLHQYDVEPLPSMTQEQTKKIMGQLWEGLYKNYIIPITESKNDEVTSYVPIILFDKEKEHLLVLFELNGEKQRLIQKYAN
ncbi:hypothetical protein [Virgibacillus ainsalahensis]